MTEDTEYCEALVRDADKDRFLATLFVPAAQRADLLTLYAFDLETAAVAHRVRDPVAGEIRLQWWHDMMSSQDGATGHPVVDAMADLVRRHDIDRRVVPDLIDARRRALYSEDGTTEAEFELSASENAGVIVRIAAQVLGGPPDEVTRLIAHHAGVLTAAGQAASDRVAFDLPRMSTRHRDAVRALIPKLPDAVLPALLPLALAVGGRASLPQWRKQWILWRASKSLARWV
jgi:15-cis-phytoene synthase